MDNLYKHPSNTYIAIYSDLLRRWTLHKFPHGHSTQVVDVRSLYASTNSYWASYVALSGWFSPSPPKINLFGSAMLCCYLLWSGDKIEPMMWLTPRKQNNRCRARAVQTTQQLTANRPFPHYLWSLSQSEFRCLPLIWKLVFIYFKGSQTTTPNIWRRTARFEVLDLRFFVCFLTRRKNERQAFFALKVLMKCKDSTQWSF